ncbi:MAG: helix-turn-helix domain-containing protein [Oscillospiraceae bacterium]|nr:helix-turn-helix domain-containing protein [Oscillospiraceae bacterium]MCI2191688.1 helix-turn-helix domain-containing protein [Oscillospiraceae bacterium]MCI2205655.1 helix-turn-helix domain-containing protein [Oscillospiraceae bacterium]
MGLERLGEIRKQKNMGLDELSKKSGVPRGTLSKISAGITKNPALDTIQAICDALGCTLDDLVSDEPNKKESSLSKTEQALEKIKLLPKDKLDSVINYIDFLLSNDPDNK